MTINSSGSQLGSYQSISYSSFRINVFSATSQTSTIAAPTTSTLPKDTVSVSPEAASQSASKPAPLASTPTDTTQTTSVTATSVQATFVSGSSTTGATTPEDPAAALFNALDADEDGSVTEDEFKAGARALLRQGRRAEHHEGVRHGDHDHRGGRRLERTLGRLFDAVDGNGDGALTKDELTAALARTSTSAQTPPAPVPDPPTPTKTPTEQTTAPTGAAGTSTTSSFVSVSISVVSVAIRSYTSIGQTGGGAPAQTTALPTGTSKTTDALPAAA